MVHKKTHTQNHDKNKTYLESRLAVLLPALIMRVVQDQNGKFVFTHAQFPDLKVEGITITYVQDELERKIRRQFKDQSHAHVDYLFNLLSKE